MEIYCKQCGQKLKQGQGFCTHCGAAVENSEPVGPETPSPSRRLKSFSGKGISKKSKIILSISVIVLAAAFFAYKIAESNHKPSKLVEHFNKTVEQGNAKELANLFNSGQTEMKVDEEGAKQFIQYLKKNPDEYTSMIKKLRNDARLLENGVEVVKPEDEPFVSIEKSDKKWNLIDQYKIVPHPFFIKVTVNRNHSLLYIDNKKMGYIEKDKERTFGPFLPSEHTVKAFYEGKYANVSDKKELDPKTDATDHNLYADLDLTGDHVTIYSDYDDAVVYVNGKSTGKRVGDIDEFGPVETDGSTKISAKLKLPAGTFKSNEVAIHEPDQEVDLHFDNLPLAEDGDDMDSFTDSTNTANELEDVLMSHYAYISSHEYEKAFDLFSARWKQKQKSKYDDWVNGIKDNYQNDVDSFSVVYSDSNRATVSFHLTSYDSKETGTLKQEWEGTWGMVKEGDQWKLDSPAIKKINSEVIE